MGRKYECDVKCREGVIKAIVKLINTEVDPVAYNRSRRASRSFKIRELRTCDTLPGSFVDVESLHFATTQAMGTPHKFIVGVCSAPSTEVAVSVFFRTPIHPSIAALWDTEREIPGCDLPNLTLSLHISTTDLSTAP